MKGKLARRKFLALGGGFLAGQMLSRGGSSRKVCDALPERFLVPLPILPVLKPAHIDDTTDFYELDQQQTVLQILPNFRTTVWGYNGLFPGPTIRARRGRQVVVRHTNHLAIPTVVHLHGGASPSDSDGFPTDFIMPGKSKIYTYPNQHRAATLWYHDHAMDHTGRNIYMGLAGLYLLEDEQERSLPLPRGEYDIPLILQDRSFAPDGSLAYVPDFIDGVHGSTVLVNGAPRPSVKVSARKYRFRILNASNSRPFRLALSNGQPFVQIATDGGLLSAPVRIHEIPLAMAERVEVIVDFSSDSVGTRFFLTDLRSAGSKDRIMQFEVVGAAHDDSAVPESLSPILPIPPDAASRTRTMVFSRGPSRSGEVRWSINGEDFDPGHPIATVRCGDVEIWRVANHTFRESHSVVHPVHLHLVNFQILDRNGRPPLAHETGWKDTVALEPGEEVRIIMQFEPYKGKFVLHCHNLEHEDRGMMARVDVV